MTLEDQQDQSRDKDVCTNSRRVLSMKKRYANLGTTVVEGLSSNHVKAAPRRSVTLEVERIPSFRRLNGDSLFVEVDNNGDDRFRHSSGDAVDRPGQQRRRLGISKRQVPAMKKRGSIQIQETKVMVQRVSAKDDVLFKDGSSKTLHTVSTFASDSSSEDAENPFSTSSGSKNLGGLHDSDLGFGFDDDETFFRCLEGFDGHISKNHRSCSDIDFQTKDTPSSQVSRPSRSKRRGGNPKYRDLGQRVKIASCIVADEVYFVPPHCSPLDLVPLSSCESSTITPFSHASAPPRRVHSNTGRKNRRSRSLESRDEASKDQRKPLAECPANNVKSPRLPRPLAETTPMQQQLLEQSSTPPKEHTSRRRRSFLSSPDIGSSQNNSKQICEALQLLSLVKKSDEDDYDSIIDSDKLAALQQEQQLLQWSLPKLLARGMHHRRGQQVRRQQHQEDLCQQFFGVSPPTA